jgi:hypothetical protein
MALFGLFFLVAIATGVYINMDKQDVKTRVTEFKNKYFPVEADIQDHILRNVPFGFSPGHHPGKLEYNNPKPLIVTNEFNYKLNEGMYGYAAGLRSRAVNTQGYQALLNDQFNIQEHNRLDITTQTPSKGRFRRTQYAFIDNTP